MQTFYFIFSYWKNEYGFRTAIYLCCDIWQLMWLLFWFKSSSAIHEKKNFSITYCGFVIFSVPVCNFLFILRGFPNFFVYYLPHCMYFLHLKHTYHSLYFLLPVLLFCILLDISWQSFVSLVRLVFFKLISKSHSFIRKF